MQTASWRSAAMELICLLIASYCACLFLPSPFLSSLALLSLGAVYGFHMHSHIACRSDSKAPANSSEERIAQKEDQEARTSNSVSNHERSTCLLQILDLSNDPYARSAGTSRHVPINCDAYYEFENEFVVGKLLFFLVHKGMDPKIARFFEGKRRLFWIQMQLRFKEVPSGELYIGGEVTHVMKLGLFTTGLAKLILSILRSLVRGLHYGFGFLYGTHNGAESIGEEELPHICFPLYTAVDQFVCTPPGEEPPVLGTMNFGESKDQSMARRKSGSSAYTYDTQSTYSYHFHSYFIDFDRWMITSVPGMKDMPLQSFWSDMPLRLVAYSLKPSLDGQERKKHKVDLHCRDAKKYFFCFELSHASIRKVDVQHSMSECNEATMDELPRLSERLYQTVESFLGEYHLSVPVWFEFCTASLDEPTAVRQRRRVGYMLQLRPSTEKRDSNTRSPLFVLVSASDAFALTEYIDNDSIDQSAHRSRRFSIDLSSSSSDKPRPNRDRNKSLSSASVNSYRQNYAQIEQERVILQQHLQEILQLSGDEDSSTVCHEQAKLGKKAIAELILTSFSRLSSSWPLLKSAAQSPKTVQTSTCFAINDRGQSYVHVIRAVSESFWRHEWMALNLESGTIEFYRPKSSRGDFCMNIPLSDVLIIRDEYDQDLYGNPEIEHSPAFFWIGFITIYACHHVAFMNREERSQWKQSVQSEMEHNVKAGGIPISQRMKKSVESVCNHLEPSVFLSSSDKSHSSKRIVLNHRCRFAFHLSKQFESIEDAESQIAQLLKKLVTLYETRGNPCSIQSLLEFMIDLQSLMYVPLRKEILQRAGTKSQETYKKALFLNIFHLLRLHTSLFPSLIPQKIQQWSRFFNHISIVVDGIYLSLAEIEHCIMRAPMSSLRLPVIKFVIPRKLQCLNSTTKEETALDPTLFALENPDFRLNFATNSLTKSSLTTLFIYQSSILDDQLADITKLAVKHQISYDKSTQTAFLPRICDWYRYDFIEDGAGSRAIVQMLLPYAESDQKRALEAMISNSRCKFKFNKYDFTFHEEIEVQYDRKQHIVRLSSQM